MKPFRLLLGTIHREKLISLATEALPNECCGFLAGSLHDGLGEVTDVLPIVNDQASPQSFRTEPASTFAAFRAMRAAGTELLAVYHSHPTSAPIPSRHDLEQNTYGNQIVWVIMGKVQTSPEIRGWWLEPYGFHEAELVESSDTIITYNHESSPHGETAMAALPKPPDSFTAFVARFPLLGEAWQKAQEAGAAGPLNEKTERLVKLGIAIGSQREGAVGSAVRKARAVGVTREEIEQVLALAATNVGFPAAVAAFTWIERALAKEANP